jgi:hypothetical protein
MSKISPATIHHMPLDAYVGVWKTEGEVIGGANNASVKFTAIDTYEWLPGGYFLFHRFDADMPEGKVQGIEVIGYSTARQTFLLFSFDNQGNTTLLHGKIDGEKWIFSGDSIRFIGGFSDNGNIFSGLWEFRSGEGSVWQPWMNVLLRKME